MRRFLSKLFGRNHLLPIRRQTRRLAAPESLERREVMTADPLPVLLVIADRQDFYNQEYNDTRLSLEAAGLEVDVAATTTSPSLSHPGTGEGSGSGGGNPDVQLNTVQASDYSAVVFVGGWGSSMYQYSFEGTYDNAGHNGDLATKELVNDLVDDVADQGMHIAAVCHGVTVLAWARVDGASPIDEKLMAVPWVAADDVVVDGRIITAENYDSAALFDRVIAREVLAAMPAENTPPVVTAATFTVAEDSPIGSAIGSVAAEDNEESDGQQLSYAITGGLRAPRDFQ